MRNKPSKKKTLLGFLWNIFEHENIELIILGLLGLVISIFGHAIYTNHSQIQADFDTLATNVRNLSYVDEELYVDCTTNVDANEIFTDVNELRDKLEVLINQNASMGDLLSVKTYCSLHGFTSWNNQLVYTGEEVCKTELLSEAEIENWRDRILNQIYKNKEDRRGPINSVKEYFTNIQRNEYHPSICTPEMLKTISP